MTRPDLIRFLQRQRLAVVSSLAPAGAPQSAVAGIATSDGGDDELLDGCKVAIRDARAHHHPRPDPNRGNGEVAARIEHRQRKRA
ncbi:MAG TPA: hypothetical protein VN853_18060 [Polyangia bacterium]|nr:hypothetical protein [Polyangia bacterium]